MWPNNVLTGRVFLLLVAVCLMLFHRDTLLPGGVLVATYGKAYSTRVEVSPSGARSVFLFCCQVSPR